MEHKPTITKGQFLALCERAINVRLGKAAQMEKEANRAYAEGSIDIDKYMVVQASCHTLFNSAKRLSSLIDVLEGSNVVSVEMRKRLGFNLV